MIPSDSLLTSSIKVRQLSILLPGHHCVPQRQFEKKKQTNFFFPGNKEKKKKRMSMWANRKITLELFR